MNTFIDRNLHRIAFSLVVAGALTLSAPTLSSQCGGCAGDKAAPGKAVDSATARLDIVDTALNAGSFQTLVTAVKAAGLVQALSGDKPYTVLAPTDAAFAKLPAGTLDTLLRPENRAKLQSILKLHVIPGRVYSTDALKARHARTLQGDNVTFNVKDGQVYVNGARVLRTDLDASNGVIHIIDSVILPE